ncbi:hypothetical protein NLX71_03075 [Paenibacillus sp. MZ04-78.2]|uniref:hypothetical protein n=1 Tax=Paenibacillus sp. MZ04-78.2 TaxID=2962034 RepID=UPI0020B83FC6|nr:hypothetical protein [Paenibacillus sp. MZ04-78.2]MCP3772300.1 hypothetical protein [Paenibacillus sp. MZ04-78.2]
MKMDVSLTIAVKDRKLGKSFRRIYSDIELLTSSLSSCELSHPIGQRVLIIATDTEGPEFFKDNSKHGDFTYFVGIEPISEDVLLKRRLFEIMKEVFENIPFTIPDHEKFREIFAFWEPSFIKADI